MKKIILLTALMLITCLSYSQYMVDTLFYMPGVTGDSTVNLGYKVLEGGTLAEVDFTSVNCDVLQLKVGYGITDSIPRYPATFSGLSNPVTLDKTNENLTNTYMGVSHSGFSIDVSEYNADYLWFHLTDDASCTAGAIIIIYKRL